MAIDDASQGVRAQRKMSPLIAVHSLDSVLDSAFSAASLPLVTAGGFAVRLAGWLESVLAPLLGRHAASAVAEFAAFGLKQAGACVFAGSFFLVLALSKHFAVPGFARYDLLFLGAIMIQAVLIAMRLETWREVAVLSLFHALGMLLELYKTSPGVHSWAYPESAFFRIRTVPLYSGFMYAAIASYLMQAWRLLDVSLLRPPPLWAAVALCAAIYGNFFTNHVFPDMRWFLGAGVMVLFWDTRVTFVVTRKRRSMPLTLSYALMGFFVWIAEGIATFFGAWVYPHQVHHWTMVHPGKISSWALLIIISFIIVAELKQVFRFVEKKRHG